MISKDEPMTIRTNACKPLRRVSSRWRWASASLFATILAACFVPTGCGASDEYVEAPPQPSEPSQSSQSSDPAHRVIPPENVNVLKACVKEGAPRLSRHAYELSFEMEVDAKGAIRGTEPKGKRLDDAKLETCLIKALEAMPMRELLALDGAEPVTSQNNSPAARALFGTTSVLPQLIRFAPIVIAAPGGITIVVAVVVVVAVAAVATMSADCQKEWDEATEECQRQSDSNNPDYGVTGGYIDIKKCARGLVAQRCGGNRYDGGGLTARPGRRT